VLSAQTPVATVGYPARDPHIPDRVPMEKIYGNVFDKKRLAPGFVTGLEAGVLTHDCATLGGNSGSALLDLATGNAAALHFAGVFLKSNYAVPAPTIATMLQDARASHSVAAPQGSKTARAAKTAAAGCSMSSTTKGWQTACAG